MRLLNKMRCTPCAVFFSVYRFILHTIFVLVLVYYLVNFSYGWSYIHFFFLFSRYKYLIVSKRVSINGGIALVLRKYWDRLIKSDKHVSANRISFHFVLHFEVDLIYAGLFLVKVLYRYGKWNPRIKKIKREREKNKTT